MEELEKQEEIEITEEVEQVSEAEEFQENDEYEYITRSKPLGRLVFMVAITAIMLVSSTYAWFSAQKNVTIGGLTGTVNVAEGLEISLDAKHWSQEIDFSKYSDQNDLKKMYGIKADGTVTGHTYDDEDLDANDIEHNIIPTELLPVSTTGTTGNGIGLTDMNMYRGIVNQENAITSLSEVITVMKNTTGYTAYNPGSSTTVVRPQDHDYPGYYAIDLFLRNSTSSTESGTANYSEILQLNNDSFLQLTNSSALTTGLQNTVRVGFALYEADGVVATDFDEDGTVTSQEWTRYIGTAGVTETNYMTASQTQILNAYYGKNIHDVAIWEPNASDHVQYIVNNYMSLPEFSLADTKLYINASATEGAKGLTSTTQGMRTYALTTAADTANTVTEIYDWATPSTGLAGQITLQTEKTSPTNYVIADGVKNLVSVTSPATAVYTTGAESGVVNFKIQDGAVAKIRMYVWLEGQDVDCINYASHGGGIYLDVGLLKDAEVGAEAGGEGTPTTPVITTLSLDKTAEQITVGNPLTITATINSDAEEDVIWTSSQTSVATVQGSGTNLKIGTVTPVGAGTTTITASNASGTVSQSCTVTVEDNVTAESTPFMPTGFTKVSDATATSGYTIKDGSGNQYVWVEVPRNATVYDEIGTDLDLDSLSGTALTTALNNIETELQEYATDYRQSGWTDTWYSEAQHGFASADEYNALKYTMLKSVYENGGFYIGKYETGTATARNADTDPLTDAVIQQNAYPYNFVTNAQAQSLASGMTSGEYTSSLMFGIQWDLVLKYLESKGATQEELKGTTTGSTNWGNYLNSTYEITNTSAKYATLANSWAWTEGAYGEKVSGTSVLLSTGADTQFNKMGIYDLAGNVYEWTLEQYTSYTYSPCAVRGGSYNYDGYFYLASYRSSVGTTFASRYFGFRVSLY